MSTSDPLLSRPDHHLITTDECSELLRVSRSTLERWRTIGGGAGPSFIKGPGKRSRVTYALGDVRDWIARNRRASTSET